MTGSHFVRLAEHSGLLASDGDNYEPARVLQICGAIRFYQEPAQRLLQQCIPSLKNSTETFWMNLQDANVGSKQSI